MGRLITRRLREEVHRFDGLKIPETILIASAQIAAQPCAQCNAIEVHAYFLIIISDATRSQDPRSKPRTNSMTFGISWAFSD